MATLQSKPTEEGVKAAVDETLASLQAPLRELNHTTAYEEHHAHNAICDFLGKQGFIVTRHAYGLDTSFQTTSGSGGRLINSNAEYDALPEIAHACGHNLITTSIVAAFLALSAVLKQYGLPGRTQLLGNPAEENGGGKAKLIDAGAYQDVDVSLMAHEFIFHAGPRELFPGVLSDGVGGVRMNARKEIHCTFRGKSAHAGGNPWEGINALDALVASYNNVAVLRQQMFPDERVHVAFLDTPKWQVRSPTLRGPNVLMSKVRNCIEAGAMANGCEVEADTGRNELYTDIKINDTLCERYQAHMGRYGRNVLTQHEKVLTGSSDIGNVSYLVPTLHTMLGITNEKGSFPYHPSFAAAAGTDSAHEEAVIVGKSLALIGWDMLTDDGLFEAARRQWQQAVE
ncbi:M20 family metallopeptidase [Aspergillus homomorphus CBS 101889]|uniref:Peptidase M20 domain-containing protein 2 n=1 Tax=Aspergillus homomorphus (strain CBS 101889) TaxID=1450537 RepID=A0A395HZK0_ASPHC|nr:hypothetical protein BO97DRAFT_450949 [Aspergillus homomorphus CBS 101889]RAL12915.1 hypothetical protein BO97DRAFT_450949 [Aspergillus homomorphus CBS 101889]